MPPPEPRSSTVSPGLSAAMAVGLPQPKATSVTGPMGWSGGPITGDNTTAEYYCTISAVAESPPARYPAWQSRCRGRNRPPPGESQTNVCVL